MSVRQPGAIEVTPVMAAAGVAALGHCIAVDVRRVLPDEDIVSLVYRQMLLASCGSPQARPRPAALRTILPWVS